MTVGIIGLGLIGGSLAKAFQRDESVTVLGWDADHSIVEFAEIAQQAASAGEAEAEVDIQRGRAADPHGWVTRL